MSDAAKLGLSRAKHELLRRLLERDGAGIPRRTERSIARASFAQERLFFLEQLLPGRPTYNAPTQLTFDGDLDVGALEKSLDAIAARHEALRTTFRSVDGQLLQVIHERSRPLLEHVDLSALPADARAARLASLADEEAARPFDLSNGPLFRATLVRLGPKSHVLLSTMHHIVVDAWSQGLFHAELQSSYRAIKSGADLDLPPLSIQYADFSEWQRARFDAGAFGADLEYWTRTLSKMPAVSSLIPDRPRAAVQQTAGHTQWLHLDRAVEAELRALAKREGVTLYMTLLAAFLVLLDRYTGEQDLVVGTPVANRKHSELEPLIGFFSNSLVLRVSTAGNPTFRELVARVREVALGAYDHEELPFEKLVEALNPERTLSHAPLFQLAFSSARAPRRPIELPGLQVEAGWRYTHTAKFELHVAWHEDEEGLRAALEYNTDLFDESTIARLIEHYRTLLSLATARPDQRIDAFPLQTSVEAERLERADDLVTVHARFLAQAERTPEALALTMGERELDYRSLSRRAHGVAQSLRALGIAAEDKVAIFVERSLEMVIAVLGILEAGATCVPLDPQQPRARLALMLEESRARVVLTEERIRALLPPTAARSLILSEIAQSDVAPSLASPLESLVYVVYTSGSTGRPKGIELPHRTLSNLVDWSLRTLAPSRSSLHLAPLGFDVSFLEIFTALNSGAALHIASDAQRRDPRALAALIEQRRIDRIVTPVPLLRELAEQFASDPTPLASLRDVVATGEQLSITEAMRALFAALPHCRLHNQYGPSETHVVTSFTLPDNPKEWPSLPPIGRPIANTSIYVLDRLGRPVPDGTPGEIHAGGFAVARGYLQDPDGTAERFLVDPFSQSPGARMYRTGDRGRLRSDGNLEFLGRVDDQLKIRGFRVEPSEVETILALHPAVASAVVVGQKERDGDQRLVAHLLPRASERPEPSQLRAFLATRLPDYMIPSAFAWRDALPLSPTGKVDRRALAEMAPSPPAPANPSDWESPVERKLAALWVELLGVEQVSPADDFFALGGHSIVAMRLVERVREAFGVTISVLNVFRTPTVAGLAQLIAPALADIGRSALPIVRRADQTRHPLSTSQEFTSLDHPPDIYRYRIARDPDLDLLTKCFNEILERHEIMRARFAVEEGRVVQRIAPHHPVAIPVDDLTSLSLDAREAQLAIIEKNERRAFDLANEPAFRVRLCALGNGEYYLLLCVHHMIFDGVSAHVFIRALAQRYRAARRGERLRLPALDFQYADFAAWQQALYSTPEGAAQLDYWKRQLAGAKELSLAADPGAAAGGSSNAVFVWRLPNPLYASLKRFCLTSKLPASTVMTAVFFAVLHRRTGLEDITLNTTTSGRYQPGTENLLGYFAQLWMLRIRFDGLRTFQELLEQVKQVIADAQAHSDVIPVTLVDNQRIRFNYLPVAPVPDSDELIARISKTTQVEKPHEADLVIEMTEDPDEIVAHVRYKERLFTAAEVKELMEQYQEILTAALAAPSAPL